MNLPAFISKRLFSNRGDSFSNIVSKIAILSIALGVAVLIVSYSILNGFTDNLKEKIFSFSGHLEISKFGSETTFKEVPISKNTYISGIAENLDNIEKLSFFAQKPCLLKTDEGIQGVVVKGIDTSYAHQRIKDLMVEGSYFSFDNDKEVIISKKLADKLRVKLHDKVMIYFVKDVQNIKIRKLNVVGFYKTEMPEFDEQFVLSNLKTVQDLNKWEDTLVGGYEIFLKDFSKLDESANLVYEEMDMNLSLLRISDKYYQIFDWFQVLDFNVQVLIFVILAVVLINVISSFFIIILEKTRAIGVLRAMGASTLLIRKIFFMRGIRILFLGLFFGNVLGLSLCILQEKFRFIPLDAENYFMSFVPIKVDYASVLFVNLLFLITVSVIIFFTTLIISTLKPIKSIKFS